MTTQKKQLPYLQIDRRQGLPSNQLHNLAVHKNNDAWIATPSGLALYDGLRVDVFSQAQGLSSHGLRCVSLFDDLLLVGTDVGLDRTDLSQLSRAEPKFESIIRSNELGMGFCENLATTATAIWLGTSTGLYQFAHVQADVRSAPKAIIEDFIEDIVVLKHDDLLVRGRKQALYHVHNGHAQVLDLDILAQGELRILAADKAEDGVAILLVDDNIYRFDYLQNMLEAYHLPISKLIVTAVYSSSTELWIGTSKGLYKSRFDPGEKTLELNECLSGPFIKDISSDKQNNILVATNDSGLYKFSSLRHVLKEFDVDSIFSIRPRLEPQYEEYYLATLRGLKHYHPKHGIQDIPYLDNFETHCWDVLEVEQGLLAASQDGLLLIDKQGNVDHLAKADSVADAPNRILQRLSSGYLLGTQTGLVYISPELKLERIRPSPDVSFGYVYSLAVDEHENLFVGTLGKGLWFGEKQTQSDSSVPNYIFRPLLFAGLPQDGNIYCVRLNSEGEIAVSCNDQIVALSVDLTTSNILYQSDTAIAGWSLLWEGLQTLWVGGSDGLYELDVTHTELVRKVEMIPGSNVWEFNSSRSLDMVSDVNEELSKYTISNSENRLLACAVRNNLTLINIQSLKSIIARPKFELRKYDWLSEEDVLINDHLVRTGKWFLEIQLRTKWALDVENLKFRYRLIGYTETWSDLVQQTNISFNSLPQGKYILEVQAYSMIVGWGAANQLFEFQVVAKGLLNKFFSGVFDRFHGIRSAVMGEMRNRELLEKEEQADVLVRSRTRELELQKALLDKQNKLLQEEASIDPLTGIANRRFLDKILTEEVKLSKRLQSSFSIMLLDVDNFKAYNDLYGHQAGDETLRRICQSVSSVLRSGGDTFARYGGEEFMIALPNSTGYDAAILARRIQARLAHEKIAHEGNHPISEHVTLSIGVASVDCATIRSFTVSELIALADKNLYLAKEHRDHTIVSSYENR